MEHELPYVAGDVVCLEDAVELRLSRLTGPRPVIEVDDRPREQPLGVDRPQLAGAQRACYLLDAVGMPAGRQLEVTRHELVGNRHQLAELLRRGLRDPHVVAQALGHLLRTVEPFEQRRRQDDLRLLPGVALQIPAHEVVEQLVGAAELDVRAHLDGVGPLEQRIEELHERDRRTRGVPLREVVAFEHPRHGDVRHHPEHVLDPHVRQPLAVPTDLESLGREVEDALHLLEVRLRV